MVSPVQVVLADSAGFSLAKWAVCGLLLVLGIRYLTNRYLKAGLESRVAATSIPESLSVRSKPVLTDAEERFFRSLEKAVDGEYLVWPQLPLWTFMDARSNDKGALAAFQNRVNRKRVDFCLVDRRTRKVDKAIELDDRSHEQLKTRGRWMSQADQQP